MGDPLGGVRVEARLFIYKDGYIVGSEGLIEILEAVRDKHSLTMAAKSLGMSYKKLWFRVSGAERALGVKLVERRRGRGEARLTREGEELVRMYREAEARLKACLPGGPRG